MQWLLTKIGLFCAQLLSYLPFSFLLFLSDLLYFIFNRIIPYRKSIIDLNLIHAFPDKRSEELWFIRNNYYRHLADFLMETIKSITMSRKQLAQRMLIQHESYALLKKYEQSGQSIFIVLGHYGNWEWASLLAALETKLPSIALYASPSNKTFEKFLLKNRTRLGGQLIANHQLKSLYVELKKQPCLVAFVADQTPVETDKAYWTKFLSQNTPFYKGFGALAQKTDAIVLYASIQKINRGFYEIKFDTITKHAAKNTEDEIVEKYVRLLENDIQQKPEYWLWSHRRWKRAGIKY